MLLDLPDLPRREIINFLSIADQLKARCVCKSLKLVIDTFHLPQNLCICSTGCPKGDEWLDCNRKKVTNNELAHLKINFEPAEGLRTKFFRNIQCLYLYEIGNSKLDLFLEQINQLTRLRVLMVYGPTISGAKKLSSSSLESLSMKHIIYATELDAPNLSSLVLWYHNCSIFYDPLCIRFPLTIKRLECNSLTPHLGQLKSLEFLVCLQFRWMNFKLEDFKFLKRLEIWPGDEGQLGEVRQIQRERETLKRPVKLIVCGFEELLVICERKITENCLKLSPDYLEQIVRNRSKFVGYAPWPVELDAGVFQRYADRVPIELLAEHFPNISYIAVKPRSFPPENPVSESGLIELLRRTGPQELRIEMNLARQFYEQFTIFNSIKSLTIIAQRYSFEIARVGNEHFETFEFQHFDCLLELKNLESINMVCPKISTDFICKLVKMSFFSRFDLHVLSAFTIGISFYQNRHLTETEWDGGPISFVLTYDFDYNLLRPSQMRKRFKGVDELIVEIKRMEENALIKSYLL